ncbi:putative disease resistance protein RGA1 [Dendrobium catenatum]|uniref:Disease resistance RPP13-like protein 1 n=1 Tax=Dendrobium catenatum TaxID=906689 RepID=A0A2I0WGN1_9ASPA|nr:putative disease resistance protein RGA1 [Dendrobium catenatum]XP_020680024.1 putative disease resistance protein RGA1 [Dendrobium catenatum]PKU74802.1 Putative disease resistance RPP13-like protein 1 [Dendrobium catenatum]
MASLLLADWFGSAIVEKLIELGLTYVQNHFFLQAGITKELKRLQDLHPKIQAIVAASNRVEISGQNPDLKKWLWQLRDAVDEAEDLLDELEYNELAKQVRKAGQDKVHKTISPFKNCCLNPKFSKYIVKEDPTLKKLRKVVKSLDEAFAGAGNFLQLVEITKDELNQQQDEQYKVRETGSLPKTDVFGREVEMKFVIEWLKRPVDDDGCTASGAMYSNISILSVVGLGGMGKTTLVQQVYSDEATNEFDLKLWVCVSNSFDVKRLLADMLESLTGRRPDLASLNALQERLKAALMSKKFFLVLDDVWEEEEKQDKSKWENVLAPLATGKEGSKILVTTRMDSVALLVTKVLRKQMVKLKLEGLQEEDCLFLFNSYAFADVKNLEAYYELKSIGIMIVKKLSGSPLAAKVIGGLLNSNLDVRHWKNVLNSDIGNAENGQNDIMPILRLSYTYLPRHLQNCFAFCSIFPRDHEFDKDDLVRMWMSLGFIQKPRFVGESMEDMGGKYFDVLVKKSIFEKVEDNHRNITYYIMHDMLHELAQSVSTQFCIRVVCDDKFPVGVPGSIRHLSIVTSRLSVLGEMKKFKNLRSLFLAYIGDNTFHENAYHGDDEKFDLVLSQIIRASKSIRLLSVRAPHFKEMPREIGDLIHLRFLKLVQTSITRLPRSLCNLYHLQVVVYEEMHQVSKNFLPKGMNSLPNLRHLILPWDEIDGMPGIGSLSFLQGIDGFRIMNENGYRIEELQHLNELRSLRIKLIENVKDAGEARTVKLKEKQHLMELFLEWGDGMKCCEDGDEYWDDGNFRDSTGHELDEHILDQLQPHTNLRKLTIHGYIGARSAVWMTPSLLGNLETIRLHKCLGWESLPPLGQLPFLKILDLSDMPQLKRIGSEFYGKGENGGFRSLEILLIRKLEALEEWSDNAAETEYHQCFPSLQKLHVLQCLKLRKLPTLPLNLTRLKLADVGLTTFPVHKHSNNNRSSVFSSLAEIEISGCREMRSLPSEELLCRFTALEHLEISYCENLRSLGGLQAVHSLKKLAIWDCPNLIQRTSWSSTMERNIPFLLEQLETNDPLLLLETPLRSLSSLQVLKIKFNNNIISFPIEAENWLLQNGTSLRELHLWDVISLQSLPSCLHEISSLLVLDVCHSPELRRLPQLPSSLQKLMVTYCHPELKERYQRNVGIEWQMISHVSYVDLCI